MSNVISSPDVSSITKTGGTTVVGGVTFTAGSNITITQSGQDFSFASTGSGAPVGASYFVVALDATLTNERALSFNGTNFSTTDLGAGNTYSVNTSQDIATTSSPTFVAPTVQRLIISGSTSSLFINANGTLDNATGNEISYSLGYIVNKATSGNSTGLLVNGLFTAAPGTNNFILDLQNAGTSRFSIDSAGQLITAATTWTLTTITSFTMQDALLRPLIYADSVSLQLKTNPVYVSPAASTSGTPAPSLTTTIPAHTNITASTEAPDMLIDMSSTKTWLAGNLANQRSLRILAPTLSLGGANTITEATTISISGPPNIGAGSGITTSIGFKLEQRALSSLVVTGIGFQVFAPTGAATNACGSFLGGNVGIGSAAGTAVSPKTWLDVRVDDITSTNNAVTCIDATLRYVGTYIGGTQIVTAPASNMSALCLDFGWAPTSNSAFNAAINQQIFTLGGSVNTTGGVRGLQSIMILNTTSPAAATQFNGITSQIQTLAASTGTIITARCYQGNTNYSGTGAITTHVAYDTGYTSNGANTVTDVIMFRAANPALSGGAVITNFTAVDVLDCTATVTTNKLGLRVRGTNLKNWIECDTSFGQASNPGALADFAGKMFITNAGLVTKYNNIACVAGGHPAEYATVNTTGLTANVAATLLYAVPASGAGQYRISVLIVETTAGSVSSTLPNAQIVYTDNQTGGTITMDATPILGVAGIGQTGALTANSIGTTVSGIICINAKASTNINYQTVNYASTAAGMAYAIHITLEAL